MQTLGTLIEAHGFDVHEHLDRADIVPVHTGCQRQGDVIVVPSKAAAAPGGVPVPVEGVAVVRGEAGGNTHLLLGDGLWRGVESRDARNLIIGELQVADGATAYLAHPEHGYLGVGPGVYRISRQREQADEVRRVAD